MKLLNEVAAIVRLDVTDFWRVRWIIAGFLSLHLAEASVMIVVLDRIISIDYVRYALPGVAVSAAALAALDQGRRVFWELQARTDFYFRSLALRRKAIPLARIAAAGMKALVYSSWVLVLLAVLSGPSWIQLLAAAFIIFLIGMVLGAVGIGMGATFREFPVWSAVTNLASFSLVATSSLFYPIGTLSAIHPFLGVIAAVNPLTGGAELLRSTLGISSIHPLHSMIIVLISLMLLVPASAGLYYRALLRDR